MPFKQRSPFAFTPPCSSRAHIRAWSADKRRPPRCTHGGPALQVHAALQRSALAAFATTRERWRLGSTRGRPSAEGARGQAASPLHVQRPHRHRRSSQAKLVAAAPRPARVGVCQRALRCCHACQGPSATASALTSLARVWSGGPSACPPGVAAGGSRIRPSRRAWCSHVARATPARATPGTPH